MYFMNGLPESYKLPNIDYSDIIHITCNDTHTLYAVATNTAVYIYQYIILQFICIGVYKRNRSSIIDDGVNQSCLFQSNTNNHILAVSTNTNTVHIVQIVLHNSNHTAHNAIDLYHGATWHDIYSTNAPPFHQCSVTTIARVKLSNDTICCMCVCQYNNVLIGTKSGYLQLVQFDGTPGTCIDANDIVSRNNKSINNSHRNNTFDVKPGVVHIESCIVLGIVTYILSNGCCVVCDDNIFHKSVSSLRFASQILVYPTSATLQRSDSTQVHYNATCCSINSKHRYIAVGLQNSDIVLYRMHIDVHNIDVAPIITFSYTRSLSQSPWGYTQRHIGSVSRMLFSPDNAVLACGYTQRGMCVWSILGTRVACTLPQLSAQQTQIDTVPSPQLNGPYHTLIGHNVMNTTNKPAGEILQDGVKTLCWTACGYNLLCISNNHMNAPSVLHNNSVTNLLQSLPNNIVDVTENNLNRTQSMNGDATSHYMQQVIYTQPEIIKLSFVHSCGTGNTSAAENTMMTLLGEDKIWMWNTQINQSNHGDHDIKHNTVIPDISNEMNAELLSDDTIHEPDNSFDIIQLPSSYLLHSWPVQYIAVSSSGNQVAIAGQYGFICYNKLIRKYRVFGNINHQQAIYTHALQWYGEHIIVVATMIQHVELLFFHRNNIDMDLLLHTHRLHHPLHTFQTFGINHNILHIQLSDGQIFVYTLDGIYNDTINNMNGSYNTLHDSTNLSNQCRFTVNLQLLYIIDMLQPVSDTTQPPTPTTKVTLSTRIHSLGIAHKPIQSRIWLRSADSLYMSDTYIKETTDSCRIRLYIPATPNNKSKSIHITDNIPVISLVVLTHHNVLLVVDIRPHDHQPIAVLRYIGGNVSQLWLHPIVSHCNTSFNNTSQSRTIQQRVEYGERLFTYGVSGYHVWYRQYHESQQFTSIQLSEYDNEIIPLGIDSVIGVFIGICKGIKTIPQTNAGYTIDGTFINHHTTQHNNRLPLNNNNNNLSNDVNGTQLTYYRIQTKLEPYLHSVLQYYLTTDDRQQQHYACDIAQLCRTHQYFTIALELLLHNALLYADQHNSNQQLQYVAQFIRQFSEYPDIIVGVARKNDSACWTRLFEYTAAPTVLFDACIQSMKYRTASKYLIIIQCMMDNTIAHQCANKLLDALQPCNDNTTTLHAMSEWRYDWCAPPSYHGPTNHQSIQYDTNSPYTQSVEWDTSYTDTVLYPPSTHLFELYYKQQQHTYKLQLYRHELINDISRFITLTAPIESPPTNDATNGFITHKVSRDSSRTYKKPELTHKHPNGVLSLPQSIMNTPDSSAADSNYNIVSPIHKQSTAQDSNTDGCMLM